MSGHQTHAPATASTTGARGPDFTALYNEHYGELYYWVLGQVRGRDVAEDICSLTFTKAFKNLHQLAEMAKFKSWLFAIAHNEARRHWGRRPTEPLEDHLDRPDPREFTEELEKWSEVQRATAMLRLINPLHRKALLCHIHGLSIEQSAKACHTSVGTFGSRLNKAKQLLRALAEV